MLLVTAASEAYKTRRRGVVSEASNTFARNMFSKLVFYPNYKLLICFKIFVNLLAINYFIIIILIN